jgi:hypothetical protein
MKPSDRPRRARWPSRLVSYWQSRAHLITRHEIVERWPLAVLVAIGGGVIPPGRC